VNGYRELLELRMSTFDYVAQNPNILLPLQGKS